MVKSVAHIAITARDMDESVRFYTEAMGLKHAFDIANPKDGSPWIVYMNLCPGQFVELFYDGTEGAPREGEAGFNHLCFAVEDIHEATRQVLDSGFKMDSMPTQGADHNWQSWVTDPNGVRIELMQIDPQSPQAAFD